MTAPAPIGDLIARFFQEDSWKVQLLSQWPSIVGDLSSKMRIEEIKNDTLIIGVFNASWLQELYMLSSVIKKTINQNLEKPYIQHIRFKSASTFYKKDIAPIKKISQSSNEYPLIVLSDPEEKALSSIKDKELQQVLHSFLTRCHYQRIA